MFEEEAKELVSMFGVDNPENTMGYILVLSALEQAYKKGEAAQPRGQPTVLCTCKQPGFDANNPAICPTCKMPHSG